jgi:hypothetical protein
MAEQAQTPAWCLAIRSKMVGLFFACLIAWVLGPIWGELSTSIIGDPRTDAIRGMWGLDHLRHSVFDGSLLQTMRVHFPTGAYALVLPLGTGLIGVVLGVLLGPVITWNLTIAIVLWGTAMGVAWLTKCLTECWLPGLLAGSIVIAQPMLHHGLADGTIEHVALWGVPLFLGAAILALQEQSVRWGLAAGGLSILVAIDSPYNAVYALVIGAIVLPWQLKWVRGRHRDMGLTLGAMGLMAIAGAAFVAWLLHPVALAQGDAATAALQGSNATDIRLWWRYTGTLGALRDATRPPTLIPTPVLVGSLFLGLLGGRKSAPWLIAGLVMLGLSFGLAEKTPALMGRWLGSPAQALGDLVLGLNRWAYELPVLGSIRFPRRWLVPSALALGVGGSIGLAQLMRRLPQAWKAWTALTVLGSIGLVWHGLSISQIRTDFPSHPLPRVAFAEYIADHDLDGAVLLLPHVRTKGSAASLCFHLPCARILRRSVPADCPRAPDGQLPEPTDPRDPSPLRWRAAPSARLVRPLSAQDLRRWHPTERTEHRQKSRAKGRAHRASRVRHALDCHRSGGLRVTGLARARSAASAVHHRGSDLR